MSFAPIHPFRLSIGGRRQNPYRMASKFGAGVRESEDEWRRKRDSNPRASFPANGFQDRRFQPLTHSSTHEGSRVKTSSVITETMFGSCDHRPENSGKVDDLQSVRRIQELHYPTHAVLF